MLDAETNPTSIQSILERILIDYAQVTHGAGTSQYPDIKDLFIALDKRFSNSLAIREHCHVRVKWSIGKGRLAKVPWIAFLDTRETKTTQQGVFCAFFFRSDMKGVYLAFTQGVKEFTDRYGKTQQAWEALQSRTVELELREYCEDLQQYGFELDRKLVVGSHDLAKGYDSSTVAHKLYLKGQVPEDRAIYQDLACVLTSYDRYVECRH